MLHVCYGKQHCHCRASAVVILDPLSTTAAASHLYEDVHDLWLCEVLTLSPPAADLAEQVTICMTGLSSVVRSSGCNCMGGLTGTSCGQLLCCWQPPFWVQPHCRSSCVWAALHYCSLRSGPHGLLVSYLHNRSLQCRVHLHCPGSCQCKI